MKKELKIGIFAFISIIIFVWGYKFLEGKDLTQQYKYLYAKYENIDMITVSTPVYVNGLKIGIVSDINILASDNQTILVEYQLDSKYNIPKDAYAEISPNGMMGDRKVEIKNMHPCTDCFASLDTIAGKNKGVLGSMLNEDEISSYMNKLKFGLNDLADSLKTNPNLQSAGSRLNNDLKDLESTIRSLKIGASSFSKMMTQSDDKIINILGHVEQLTTTLSKKEDAIGLIIENFKQISENFKEIDLKKTMNGADESIAELKKTLGSTTDAFDKFNKLLADLNEGKGTAGKILSKEDLYDNFVNVTSELELLLQDLRLNPKRYINVSVFGKKQKKYEVPENDPARVISE